MLNPSEWLSAIEARKVLGLGSSNKSLLKLAASGLVTTREVPGTRRKYLAADVRRLVTSSTRPATARA